MARRRMPSRWSWSTGERGVNRVRVYEHAASGVLYVEWYEARQDDRGPLRRAQNLGHQDRERAKSEAYDLAARLLRGEVERREAASDPERGPLTLGALLDNYLSEVTPGKVTARHDRRAAKLFPALWGRHRVVRSLSERDGTSSCDVGVQASSRRLGRSEAWRSASASSNRISSSCGPC